MSDSKPGVIESSNLRKLPKRWKGYLAGTNRGRIWLRLRERPTRVEGHALFFDQVLGHAVIRLEGQRHGRTLELRILSFQGLAPPGASPLDGDVKFELADDLRSATGTWHTDVGTQGTGWVRARGAPGSFLTRSVFARLRFLWRRHLPPVYALFVGTLAVLGSLERIKLSTPVLVLILVPAPYVFRRHIAHLIQAFKLRRLGPVELGEQSPINPQLGNLVRQQVEGTVRLMLLDGFFVPRTKALLAWLASKGSVTKQEFDQMASVFGVAPDNVETTRSVIVEFGCAMLTNDVVAITPWGRRYVAHLAGQ